MFDYGLGVLGVLGIGFVVVLVLAVAVCVFSLWVNVRALKIMEYDDPRLGWVPIVSTWVLADSTVDDQGYGYIFGKAIDNRVYNCMPFLLIFLNLVPTIGSLAYFVAGGIYRQSVYSPIHTVIKGCEEEEVKTLSWICGFVPAVFWVMVVTCKEGV